MNESQLEAFADYVRSYVRDAYLQHQETLENNVQKRAFDLFPDAFTHDQQRVIQRVAEEILRADEALCNDYSRTIIGALHKHREDFLK